MNLLAFFAHPDDETMLCGGTLALLEQEGVHVHVLIATRGEGGEVGNPPLTEPELLGEVRVREMQCAGEALGVSSVYFLDYEDPRVGPDDTLFPYTEDLARLTEEILSFLDSTRADALLTHGKNGEYGHPAHLISHRAAHEAAAQLSRPMLVYSASASFPEHPRPRLTNEDEPAHLIVDVSSVLEKKTAAALCHRTQNDLFTRRASEEAGRTLTVPEIIIPVEGLHRSLPPVAGDGPDDFVAQALRPYLGGEVR